MSGLIFAGATLSISSVIGNSYIANFSIANLEYSGTTITTNPSFWGTDLPYQNGTTAGSYLPTGTAGGYLWLIDNTLDDTSEFGPNVIPILTDLSGNGQLTFNVSIRSLYNFNLYYQYGTGTLNNETGQLGTDIVFVSSFSFVPPPISDGGHFQIYNPVTDTISGTTANIGSTFFSYNTTPIGGTFGSDFSGTIGIYKTSPLSGVVTESGSVSGVTGTLVGSTEAYALKAASGTIPISHGITFDSNFGDFYSIYYPFANDMTRSSENYVGLPSINLPFTVDYSDFYGISGSTAITVELKNIQYNYAGLTAGQQVLLGTSGGTQLLDVFIDSFGTPSATFISEQSTTGNRVYFYNGVTSSSYYTVPTFVSGQEEILGRYTTSNMSNNGFTINITGFDYLDSDGYSIFDIAHYPTPAAGFIRIQGPDYYFREVRYVQGRTNYSFLVNSSLPFNSSRIAYTITFVRNAVGLMSASDEYVVSWKGINSSVEEMKGNIYNIIDGTTLTVNLNNFDYLDICGNSIFSSTYYPIEIATIFTGGNAYSSNTNNVLSGGTAGSAGGIVYSSLFNHPTKTPPDGFQQAGPTAGATLTQVDSFRYSITTGTTGAHYFGVSGPTAFAVGTNVVGFQTSGFSNSLAGTVLSCSSTGLVVNLTNSIINQQSMSPWIFNGNYYSQSNEGHTGLVELLGPSGNVLSTTLWTIPYSGTTLVFGATGQTLTSVPSVYSLAFYDNSLGIRRSSVLTTRASLPLPQNVSGQSFIGTVSDVTASSFVLSGFDYLLYGTSIVDGVSGGVLNLYEGPDIVSDLLYTIPVGPSGTTYAFSISGILSANNIIQYQNPSQGFFGTSYKQSIMATSGYTGPTGTTFFGPWTTGSYQGLSGGTLANADFSYSYMHKGTASRSVIYKLIANVDTIIPTSQTITVKIPAVEMSRMLIYQSGWGGIPADPVTGLPLQGFIGGGPYGSSGTTMDPNGGYQLNAAGLSGPNVALLLNSVLHNVNYLETPMGQPPNTAGIVQDFDVLSRLDFQFTSESGNRFVDDAGVTITSVYELWRGMTFGSSGSSILNQIPAETISSITNSGLTITSLSSVLKDVDTIVGATGDYAPALSNLFAETAAYGRANDKIPISVSSIAGSTGQYYFQGPSGPAGFTAAAASSIANQWANSGIFKTFGVDFAPGDSLTLYITYAFSKGRVYTLEPNVVQLLQTNYGFAIGNVASLVIGGKTIKLQTLDANGNVDLVGAANDAGTDISRVIGIKLLAVPSNSYNTVSKFAS